MRTAQGAQIDAQSVSGPSIDMHTTAKKAPRRGDRSWGWAGTLGTHNTEVQMLSHEGFRSASIHTRATPSQRLASAPPTAILAKPPGWSEASDRPCDPPSDYDKATAKKHMDLWDVNEHTIRNGPEHAARLCSGCPVRLACLTAALEEEGTVSPSHRYMVRGGMTPRQRHALGALAGSTGTATI